jgi:hypothetical protein
MITLILHFLYLVKAVIRRHDDGCGDRGRAGAQILHALQSQSR